MKIFMIVVSLACSILSGTSFPRQQIKKTIKMKNGQVYNCVDFYKQPAFRNPSLNLTVTSNWAKIQEHKSTTEFGLIGRGCPIGTIPIMDHYNANDRKIDVQEPLSFPRLDTVSHCSAKVQTRADDPNKKFFGGNALINVYKPKVYGSQWSSARIKVVNGGESIEAGWMVNPSEFKDQEAHLYGSFNVGGKECINLNCSGFVQVSSDIPLGVAADAYSVIEGQQVGWNVSIDKHQDSGDWWLSILDTKKPIGYWPYGLFSSLRSNANQVEFGGEFNNPSGVSPLPEMGNGHVAAYNTKSSSCFVHATVVDDSYNNVNPPDTEKYQDCNLYHVLDGGYHDDPKLGRLIFYGGPLQ